MVKAYSNGVGGNHGRRVHRKMWLLRKARKRTGPVRVRARSIAAQWGISSESTRNSVVISHDQSVEVLLPATLDFEDNYESTAAHLALIRQAAIRRRRLKELHFDAITSVSPAAALVLASEVDRWRQRVGGRLRANVSRWDPEIKRLLGQMGYFELLGLERPVDHDHAGDTTFINFLRSDLNHSNGGQLAKTLRIAIEEIVGQEIKRHLLFEGLSEAITNVSQHAYPSWSYSAGTKQWWLSASFERRARRLIVMFYDQGVGIPRTLPSSHIWEWIKGRVDLWTDAQKIEAAMEYGRSQTARPERGKGLKNLLEFARAHAEGKLSIFSDHGLYQAVNTGNGELASSCRDLRTSIGGTLIEWSVKL